MNRVLAIVATLAFSSTAFAQDVSLILDDWECPDIFTSRSVQDGPCGDNGVWYDITYFETTCVPAPSVPDPNTPTECTCGEPQVIGNDRVCIELIDPEPEVEWQGPVGPIDFPGGVQF